MEYAKDIVLDLKKGQAVEGKVKTKRSGAVKEVCKMISEHKVISSIVTATVSFIVIDALLIVNFVNILTKL